MWVQVSASLDRCSHRDLFEVTTECIQHQIKTLRELSFAGDDKHHHKHFWEYHYCPVAQRFLAACDRRLTIHCSSLGDSPCLSSCRKRPARSRVTGRWMDTDWEETSYLMQWAKWLPATSTETNKPMVGIAGSEVILLDFKAATISELGWGGSCHGYWVLLCVCGCTECIGSVGVMYLYTSPSCWALTGCLPTLPWWP